MPTEKSTTTSVSTDDCCPICNVTVKKKDKAFQCYICNLWHHIGCEGITDEEYESLSKSKRFIGLCDKCISTPRPPSSLQSDQSQALNELKDMMAQVLKSMNNITERIANMEKSMEGKANIDVVKGLDERLKKLESKQDQVEQLESTGKDQVQARIIEMINVKAKEQQEEAEDRARRSKNLLIFGLDEPKKEDKDERKAEETGTVQNIMKEIKFEDCK